MLAIPSRQEQNPIERLISSTDVAERARGLLRLQEDIGLPRNIEAEQALLGAILMDNRALNAVSNIIRPDHFFEPVHRRMFEVAAGVIEQGKIANPITLKTFLGDADLGGITVSQYLAKLVAEAVTVVNAPDYARTIADLSARRDMLAVLLDAAAAAFDAPVDKGPASIIAEARAGLEFIEKRVEAAKPRDFGRVRWIDLDKQTVEQADDYIIEGLLTTGDRSAIAGPSKSGKSFLAIHASLCVALGREFFGLPVLKPGLVIYQAGEGASGVKKRLKAFRQHFDVPSQMPIPFELLTDPLDLLNDEQVSAFMAACKRIASEWHDSQHVLTVIDTFAAATPGCDENNVKDMSRAIANVARIQKECGCHVLLVHHLNAAGTKLRGHTSLPAALDQIIGVTRNETTNVRTARIDKAKDDEDGGMFRFALHPIELGRNPVTDKPITSCVCLEVEEKEALRKETEAKGIALSEQESVLFRAVMAALKLKGQPVPNGCQAPSSVSEVVLWSDVLAAYAKQNPPDFDQTDMSDTDRQAAVAKHKENHKKRVQRSRERLSKIGVIAVESPYAWWTGKPARGFPETLRKREPEPEPIAMPHADDGMPF
jgi:hypothetical protein